MRVREMIFFPPVKRLGLRIFSIACAGICLFLAISLAVWQIKNQNYLIGAVSSVLLIIFALAFLRVKQWVFKLTCALLLCVASFSIFYIFPPFGDGVAQSNKIMTICFLMGGAMIFLILCIIYNNDFL